MITTRTMIEECMGENNDSWENVISCTLCDQDLNTEKELQVCDLIYSYTVWTHSRVYFPASWDGHEFVGCVPRNPNGVATKPMGTG